MQFLITVDDPAKKVAKFLGNFYRDNFRPNFAVTEHFVPKMKL